MYYFFFFIKYHKITNTSKHLKFLSGIDRYKNKIKIVLFHQELTLYLPTYFFIFKFV